MAEAAATATEAASPWGTVFSNLLMTYQQKQLMKINAERAAQGLPPLTAVEAGMQAQVGAQVGLDKDTRNVVIAGIAMLGLIGLALALRK